VDERMENVEGVGRLRVSMNLELRDTPGMLVDALLPF